MAEQESVETTMRSVKQEMAKYTAEVAAVIEDKTVKVRVSPNNVQEIAEERDESALITDKNANKVF